ncbi:MAG: hypothetical protein AB1742_08945 [bacterium]
MPSGTEREKGAALVEVLAISVAASIAIGIIILKLKPVQKIVPAAGAGPVVVLGEGVGLDIRKRTERADEVLAFTLKTACRHNVSVINTSVEMWRVLNGRWPKEDLSDVARDRDYFPNGIPRCPVNNTPYRLDPVLHRVVGHEHTEIINPFEETEKDAVIRKKIIEKPPGKKPRKR